MLSRLINPGSDEVDALINQSDIHECVSNADLQMRVLINAKYVAGDFFKSRQVRVIISEIHQSLICQQRIRRKDSCLSCGILKLDRPGFCILAKRCGASRQPIINLGENSPCLGVVGMLRDHLLQTVHDITLENGMIDQGQSLRFGQASSLILGAVIKDPDDRGDSTLHAKNTPSQRIHRCFKGCIGGQILN